MRSTQAPRSLLLVDVVGGPGDGQQMWMDARTAAPPRQGYALRCPSPVDAPWEEATAEHVYHLDPIRARFVYLGVYPRNQGKTTAQQDHRSSRRRREHTVRPTLTTELVKDILARLRDGSTTLKRERIRLGYASNAPLRKALIQALDSREEYLALVQVRRRIAETSTVR